MTLQEMKDQATIGQSSTCKMHVNDMQPILDHIKNLPNFWDYDPGLSWIQWEEDGICYKFTFEKTGSLISSIQLCTLTIIEKE